MGDGPHILIIEDDDAIRLTVSMLLELDAYRVTCAANGAEALDRIVDEGLPDLILLDMRMPVMDGWRFAEALRARHGRAVPVVVMTAASDARQRACDIGADAMLEKPFALEELQETLRRVLREPRRLTG